MEPLTRNSAKVTLSELAQNKFSGNYRHYKSYYSASIIKNEAEAGLRSQGYFCAIALTLHVLAGSAFLRLLKMNPASQVYQSHPGLFMSRLPIMPDAVMLVAYFPYLL